MTRREFVSLHCEVLGFMPNKRLLSAMAKAGMFTLDSDIED